MHVQGRHSNKNVAETQDWRLMKLAQGVDIENDMDYRDFTNYNI